MKAELYKKGLVQSTISQSGLEYQDAKNRAPRKDKKKTTTKSVGLHR